MPGNLSDLPSKFEGLTEAMKALYRLGTGQIPILYGIATPIEIWVHFR